MVRFGQHLTILSIVFVGCGKQSPTVITDPAEVERLARIVLPPSATNLYCRTERGIDRVTYGRFEIPISDLSRVLDPMREGGTVKPFEGYSNVTSHEMAEPWWQPARLRNPRLAEWSEPGYSVNLIFGEMEQVGQLTVYFFNFEM